MNNIETNGVDALDTKIAVMLDAITTAGTSTAYTLTTTSALALATNERFHVIFNATAGASPTLNRDSKGAKALKYYDNTGVKIACGAKTIISGMHSDIVYDGTDYVVMTIAQPHQTNARDVNLTPWITVQKTADQTLNSTTTLTSDSLLTITILSSTKYAIRGSIFFDTVAAADYKWRFNGSATATLIRLRYKQVIPGTTASVEGVETAFLTNTITAVGTGTTMGFIEFEAIFHCNVGGTFIYQFAQNTSDAGSTTTLAGSYIEYMVVA
jgi:hypothetical protein